jgi:hypothetical protein
MTKWHGVCADVSWDGEVVSGPKADSPQVGDEGPAVSLKCGDEMWVMLVTNYAADGKWELPPDVVKSIREDTAGKWHGLKIPSDKQEIPALPTARKG